MLPRVVKNLIEAFERLPGIGEKTAQRLSFYLLHVSKKELEQFAQALLNLKEKTKLCSICRNVSETDPCSICSIPRRNKKIICIVEEPIDVLVIEKTGRFNGLYHVLHGRIDPLNNIGPEEIYIADLITRIKKEPPFEIILATNLNMEGEATAMYIAEAVRKLKTQNSKLKTIKMTRLSPGLPIGGDLEYADEITLSRALEGRRDY